MLQPVGGVGFAYLAFGSQGGSPAASICGIDAYCEPAVSTGSIVMLRLKAPLSPSQDWMCSRASVCEANVTASGCPTGSTFDQKPNPKQFPTKMPASG